VNSDDPLMQAFQRQQPAASRVRLEKIGIQVRAQRRWHALRRGLEILLSLAAVGFFAFRLFNGQLGPQDWVLLPFFAVFLPLIWLLILRGSRRKFSRATDAAADFANHRLAQLRANLREVWLARRAVHGLVLYAIAVFALTRWRGDAGWQEAGIYLLMWSLLWGLLAGLILRWYRPRLLREYRALRRLLPSARDLA